jgi:hypothetical protein
MYEGGYLENKNQMQREQAKQPLAFICSVSWSVDDFMAVLVKSTIFTCMTVIF